MHPLQAGCIEPFDALAAEAEAVGDHGDNHAATAHRADQILQLRMQQRFAAGQGDGCGLELCQVRDLRQQGWQRNRWREVVVFVAVTATEIATPSHHHLRQQRAVARRQRTLEEAQARSQRSEEHTSELQSLMRISYAVFCLKKKKKMHTTYKCMTKLRLVSKMTE